MKTTAGGAHLDLLPNDPELQLLIDCARLSIEPHRVSRIRVLAGRVDWDRLATLARRNGLAPLLFWHVNTICGRSVPPRVLAVLRDYFQKNGAFGVLLTGELVRLLQALGRSGIEAIPYKGPALAAQLYGNVALRQFCDLDILVPERDVWRASEVIEGAGFVPDFVIPDEKRTAFVRQDCVRLFRRDAGRTLVELHWGIVPRFFAARFDAGALWRLVEPMPIQGATVMMPCREDQLLMLCVHGAKHCWDKLEAVSSIAALLRNADDLDWQRVWERSRQMHCRRMLLSGLLLAQGLFDIPLPPQVTSSRSRTLFPILRKVVRDFGADETPPRPLSGLIAFHLRLKDSYADQVRYCARLLWTTTPVDWATMRLRGSLACAYPLWRAIRLARKYAFNKAHTTTGTLTSHAR